MAKIFKKKKEVLEEELKEQEAKQEIAEAVAQLDPSLPESKQRHLR